MYYLHGKQCKYIWVAHTIPAPDRTTCGRIRCHMAPFLSRTGLSRSLSRSLSLSLCLSLALSRFRSLSLALSCSLSLSLFLSLTLSLFLHRSLFLALSCSLPPPLFLSLSLSCACVHADTCTHTLPVSLTHTHPPHLALCYLPLSLAHTNTLSHTHTYTHAHSSTPSCLTVYHILSHTLFFSLSLSHTHTLTRSLTPSYSGCLSLSLWFSAYFFRPPLSVSFFLSFLLVAVCCSTPRALSSATHCNTLQHTATTSPLFYLSLCHAVDLSLFSCNTLQHTATASSPFHPSLCHAVDLCLLFLLRLVRARSLIIFDATNCFTHVCRTCVKHLYVS